MLNFDHIKARLENPITGPTNERASLIEMFVVRINNSRLEAGYKPYPKGMIASKMSHHKTDDLMAYYKELSNSKNFCALWHWQNMPKKSQLK